MILTILYPYLRFAIGTLYPSYKTWKALKRKDETTRRRWMKYWVSYGAFQMLELVADFTLAFIVPFYIEIKLAITLWLVLGTKLIFDTIVNRELTKREKSIDRFLNKIIKVRDEIVASIWFEVSRCLIKIITSVMSGGLLNFSTDDERSEKKCSDTDEQHQTPMDAEEDDEKSSDDTIIYQQQQQQSRIKLERKETNNNDINVQ